MGTATEIVRYRKEKNGRIIEFVIWRLSEQIPGSTHMFKYRLFYGMANGTCLVRYDNERGKGDHRHVGDVEEAYCFTTLRTLLDDFESDIERN
jgi:hypothetical protein